MISYSKKRSKTKKISFSGLEPALSHSEKQKITLDQKSTMEAALSFAQHNPALKIIVINFAGAERPGGTQEGCLHTQTTLGKELEKQVSQGAYPILMDELIVNETIEILTDDFGKILSNPCYIGVVSSPAVDTRTTTIDTENYAQDMKRRITAHVLAAAKLKADVLISGAFGCGVFGGDPNIVARLYKEIIEDHKGLIPWVHFSIYRGGENFTAFKTEFQDASAT